PKRMRTTVTVRGRPDGVWRRSVYVTASATITTTPVTTGYHRRSPPAVERVPMVSARSRTMSHPTTHGSATIPPAYPMSTVGARIAQASNGNTTMTGMAQRWTPPGSLPYVTTTATNDP